MVNLPNPLEEKMTFLLIAQISQLELATFKNPPF